MMTIACKFNSSALSQIGYAWYWTNKTLYFSLYNRYINCEVHIYLGIIKPYQQLWELSIAELKKSSKGEFFQTTTMFKILYPASWISTSWVLQGHGMHEHEDGTFLLRHRNNSPSNQGHNTQHHPWLHSCENLKIHNNNVIGLTFIHPQYPSLNNKVWQICRFGECTWQHDKRYSYRKY